MMMKIGNFMYMGMAVLFAAALSACLVSCKKDEGSSGLHANMVDFNSSNRKAYIDPEQYSCFVVGEKIRVNKSTGKITALVDGNARHCVIGGVAEAANYHAFYPADLMTNVDADLGNGLSDLAVTLPVVQHYARNNGGFQIIQNPMMAVLKGAGENNRTLQFRNLCALLKLTVRTNDAFDAVRIRIHGVKLSGKGKIDVLSNKIVMDADGGADSVELRLPAGHVGTPMGENFYVVVPEVKMTGKQKMVDVLFLRKGSVIKKYSAIIPDLKFVFEANNIHTLGQFTFNSGVFSVSPDRKVVFAPGNLQWSYSAMATSHSTATCKLTDYTFGTWRFAENQYDYVGADNSLASAMCSTWVDLFCWGSSGYFHEDYGSCDPFEPSRMSPRGDSLNSTSDFRYFDWGRFNTIYNPKTKTNDPFGTWHTLSMSEWKYLLMTRPGWRHSFVSFPISANDTVNGMIVYPDGITARSAGVSGILDSNSKTVYHISKETYDSLERAGCLFLPSAGSTISERWIGTGYDGSYWTASKGNKKILYHMWFQLTPHREDVVNFSPIASSSRRAVRLARDVK